MALFLSEVVEEMMTDGNVITMFGAGRIGKRRISVDHYYPDRGMELVSALDVEGDCKEPHMPQELKLSPPKCAFHPLSFFMLVLAC
ncbi:hypothetical protein DAPPUDRAFT_271991 [Daphnia pulex]|uniref:Uncharacterized protein n=1 Tax=Daphnia pulex TaxID=6669 RepID=E9I2N3_DAPPU|nr:hypothetical protein DAPPUDRAFT_271991 [Daphnia pulex]|eukprot:EFX61747.1 hypothetical protein DAPPUDRAFT_271991 [Daphnia pulex]